MNGGTRSYAQRGIIPRAIGHIFRTLQSRTDIAVIVRCSYLEVYNDEFCKLGDCVLMLMAEMRCDHVDDLVM